MPVNTRLRSILCALALVVSVSALPLAFVVIASLWRGIPLPTLTRDLSTIGHLPFYAGFLSQVGLFVWVSALSVTSFISLLLWKKRSATGLFSFMLASTALTLLLLLDDAFLLHESVFPSFGIPEKLVYFTYMCAVAFYLTVFYKIIFRTEFIYLTLSFLFLGLSIALDVIVPDTSSDYLLEDGLKFLGLVSWMLYFWSVARCEILNQRV